MNFLKRVTHAAKKHFVGNGVKKFKLMVRLLLFDANNFKMNKIELIKFFPYPHG